MDNLLCHKLGAVHVTVTKEDHFFRLMGNSLALFMVGMSLSPAIVSLLPNFFTSFVTALFVFAVPILYLSFFVPRHWCPSLLATENTAVTLKMMSLGQALSRLISFAKQYRCFVHLFTYLWRDQRVALPVLALLLYNTILAYLSFALMVYSSLRFSFIGKDNDYLISLAAGLIM